ncbi:8-amino-7-oxononanoate synthase [Motiliproteus coralliicola]|uniref:8-amino-7-oxononanoate synthase n=1 Tax=Motiliproteus coralliicola TaxID=2283196 RepID=A0A369WTT8_9GAMM|nr:8-amino-7-oxononanoate synthase [Motiliproteus coralliicola]RDE25087.1 8-amino-7-oxononanoate synthase [Motiliproteus coralliicola]
MAGFEGLEQALQQRQQDALYRVRRTLESAQAPEVVVEGRQYLAFCSNDYLGLANHPQVINAFTDAAQKFGVGSGASHLVNGHSRYHHQLEEALAEFTGRPRALLFSTGYMANLGAINALIGKGDAVFEDRLNHASLLDAGLLSGARFQRYLHNDADSLGKKLARTEANRKLVVTDGVFSMDGDIAPLTELADVTRQHDGWLMVDDAHGFGCLGETGGGCAQAFGMSLEQLPVLVGTLGKGFGTAGAFVAGSEVLIETLIQHARSYIYTTAMPPAVAAATLASLQLIRDGQHLRQQLETLISRFRRGAQQLGLELMNSTTPIQPILIGDSARALQISAALEQQGIFVTAIRPPTVPEGSARLRVTLSAAHTEQQVDRLLGALEQVCQ